MSQSWWNRNYNGITPFQYLRQNWQELSDREIAVYLSRMTGQEVTPNAVKRKRHKNGLKIPRSSDEPFVPEWSIPDPTADVEPYRFRETGRNTGELIHVSEVCPEGAIKTVDQVIAESGMDLTVWRVGDKVTVNKWPVGAKAEKKDITWKDGKIIDGYVKSDGLTVAQLWQVTVPFVRIKPEPIFPIIQPIECDVTFKPPPKPTGGGLKRSLVWTDPQFGFIRDLMTGKLTPLHDDQVIDVILQIAIAAQVDRVDMLGDIFDLSDMSDRFLRLPEFRECFQPAIIAAFSWFSRFRQALSDAYMTTHEGNHDKRLMMATAAHLRSAYDIRAADEIELPPALSVPRLLALHKLGIEWIGGYPRDEDWLNDGLRLSHGTVARSQLGATSRAIVEDAETSEVVGHIHRMESASKTIHHRNTRRVVRAHCVGCACHIDGRVPSNTDREQWQNACAIVDYDPDGTDYAYTGILIESGRAVWNGQVFEAREGEIPI